MDDADKTPRASGAWFICHARAELVAESCEHAAFLMTKRLEVISSKGAEIALAIARDARALADQFGEWRPVSAADFDGWAPLRDRLAQVEEAAEAMFKKFDSHPKTRLRP